MGCITLPASTGVSNASFLTPVTSHLSISVVVISYMNISESTLESNDEEFTRDASAGGTRADEHEASARAGCCSGREAFDNGGNLAGVVDVESDARAPPLSL